MRSLLSFEIKKIVNSPLNWAVLGAMTILIITIVSINILDSPPKTYLKNERGLLIAEKIDEVILANATIALEPLNFEHGVIKQSVYQKKWRQYTKFEKYISATYQVKAGVKIQPGKTVIDYLGPGVGQEFYKERLARVQEQLALSAKGSGEGEDPAADSTREYTKTSRDRLLGMQKNLKTPFYFEYFDGWLVALGLLRLVLLTVAAGVTICLTPVFTYDYQCDMDQLLSATVYGKSKLLSAKIIGSLIFLTLVFGVIMGSYSIILFYVYGFDGYSAPFQLLQWFSPYQFTVSQAYILCLLMGYLSCCLVAAGVMLLSVISKNMPITMALSWLMLLLPLFMSTQIGGPRGLTALLLDILPTNLMNSFDVFGTQGIYQIGNCSILQPQLQIITSILIICALVKLTAIIYKRHHVS